MKYTLENLSAVEIGRLVNERKITPTKVLNYFRKRIERYNPLLNAFTYLRWDEAYKKAKEMEDQLKRGVKFGEFAGVPFALKDFLDSKKGWTHSFGGVKCLANFVDMMDSEFCKAMEKLGGIAIGKTNAPSFGFSGLCSNKLYGATRNPFNYEFSSGGSSGGSAAAVAAGLVPIAEGGDAGGSIRIPASWCNIIGFKASAGMVPNVCRPDAWSATHPYCINGGLTKTVEDAQILFKEMRKRDLRDPLNYGKDDFTDKRLLKVAYTYDFGVFKVNNDVKKAMKEFIKSHFPEAELIDISLPRSVDELSKVWCRAISIDTAIEIEEWKKSGIDLYKHADELPEAFLEWNKKAFNSSIMDYYEFHKARTELYDMQQDIFDEYDILICPVSARGAYRLNEDTQDPMDLIGFSETFIFNMTGNPSISIPCGYDNNGLPLGVQVVGKIHHDLELLNFVKGVHK